MLRLAPWILPPFLGAVIGYVTNAIAIRMLFRPLRAKHILGLKLPLTPGVIPRQRYQLAESIGRMVSRELITEETLRTQLASSKFKQGFGSNISAFTQDLLDKPLGSFSPANQQTIYAVIGKLIGESLFRFFNSRSFIYAVRGLITRMVRHVWDQKVGELVSALDLENVLSRALSTLLKGPNVSTYLSNAVCAWVDELREKNTRLDLIVTEELVEAAVGLFRSHLPQLKRAVFEWLRQDTTRRDLEVRGRFLLRDILARLNILQKFIISAGQFDRTLEEKMPAIVEDVLHYLEGAADNEQNRTKIEKALRAAIMKWRKKEVGEVIVAPPEQIQIAVEKLVNGLVSGATIEHRIQKALVQFISSNKDTSIGDLIGTYIRESDVVEFACFHLLAYLSQKHTAEMISAEVVGMVGAFLEDKRDTSVNELVGIAPERKSEIDRFLANKIIAIVDRKLPDLFRSFDVKTLVVERINNLDVEQVERLLLQVIARHLKWINVFGGILGAIIGLSQIALRLVQRGP